MVDQLAGKQDEARKAELITPPQKCRQFCRERFLRPVGKLFRPEVLDAGFRRIGNDEPKVRILRKRQISIIILIGIHTAGNRADFPAFGDGFPLLHAADIQVIPAVLRRKHLAEAALDRLDYNRLASVSSELIHSLQKIVRKAP